MWETSGRHLGAIWRREAEEAPGRQMEDKTHKTSLILQRNADLPLQFQFHKAFLRVALRLYAYLQRYLLTDSTTGEPQGPRALYREREKPPSDKSAWGIFIRPAEAR